LGYDRLIAIGDRLWTDYEVTVPFIFYSIDTVGGFGNPSNGPGVGLLLRWTGHTDTPLAGWQPKSGYLPLGAIAWYHWDWIDPNLPPRFELLGNGLNSKGEAGSILSSNVWYYMKMRVETVPGVGGSYKVKVWPVGQTEPATWTLEGQESLSDPQHGSILLVSHHVDAEFGDVTITQLAPPLPVQLASFTAHVQPDNSVRLDWTTLSEINNYGFEVQKSRERTNNFITIPNSFIPGHGTSLEPHFYTFVDRATAPGFWYYRLKQIDLDGTLHYSDPIEVAILTSVPESHTPFTFSLEQNSPNPFNPSTRISFQIQEYGFVSLGVYDMLGRRVASLVEKFMQPGSYSVWFNAENLPSGVYVYRLNAGGNSRSRRMVLVR
jgi:hypothetical protein